MQLELGSGFLPLWVQKPWLLTEFILACFHDQSLLVWNCSVCLLWRISLVEQQESRLKQQMVFVLCGGGDSLPSQHSLINSILALKMVRSYGQWLTSFPKNCTAGAFLSFQLLLCKQLQCLWLHCSLAVQAKISKLLWFPLFLVPTPDPPQILLLLPPGCFQNL